MIFTKRFFLTLAFLTLVIMLSVLVAGCGQTQPASSDTTATHTVSQGDICGEDINYNGNQMIKNGQFRSGLTNWQTVDVPGNRGIDHAQIEDDRSCGNVLVMTREGSLNTTGLIGVEQGVQVDRDGLTSLELQMVAKIDQQDLRSDGKLGGETPVFVTLDYVTAGGVEKSWTHGLMITGDINYPDRDQSIPPVYWATYKSGDILTMLPDMRLINKVTIGGNGWDFRSRIAYVSLLARPG